MKTNLKQILKSGESETVKFKQSLVERLEKELSKRIKTDAILC
jgi:predicted HTH transcriptional regulator